MGTSGSYGGAGSNSPLEPTWLNDPTPASAPVFPAPEPLGPAAPNPAPTTPQSPPPDQTPLLPATQQPIPNRFAAPRANFSRFARSGGAARAALGRALSCYVSTAAGGARRAARRMGPSRNAGARLYAFLADVQERGPVEALRSINLQALAGRPIEEVFLGITEYVCPVGGSVDEGIARDAFIETVADLASQGITDFDGLTADQAQTVFEMFATHAIEARITNDIGKNEIKLPADVAAIARVQAQLHDFVARAVADALSRASGTSGPLTQQQALQHVDTIYEAAFDMLRVLADAEADE